MDTLSEKLFRFDDAVLTLQISTCYATLNGERKGE
jgi:hypothetical protein